MVTAKNKHKKQKPYPDCLAHAVNDMFFSVDANQRHPQHTYHVSSVRATAAWVEVPKSIKSFLSHILLILPPPGRQNALNPFPSPKIIPV